MLIGLCCMVVGFVVGSGYEARQFKHKAFGYNIRHGILAPQYAYAELIGSQDSRARRASLLDIVKNGMQFHGAIAKKLEAVFGDEDPESIPPTAALAMGHFDLNNYLNHPDRRQRLAAVHASRWWRHEGKLGVLYKFLDDEDECIVGQAIYEIGYIGDKSALEVLSNAKFDNNNFIDKVRHALKYGEQFR
jgi:HEAT repeat protein